MSKPFAVHRPGALGDVVVALALRESIVKVKGGCTYFVAEPTYQTLAPLAAALGIPMWPISQLDPSAWEVHPLIGYPFHPDGKPAWMARHMVWYFANEMGVPANTSMRLPLPKFQVDKPYVTLQTTAGWSTLKNWAPAKWDELSRMIQARGYGVVQIGGPNDAVIPSANTSLLGQSFMTNLRAQGLAVAHAGPDSVFNHTSGLVEWGDQRKKTPAVILFGSTNPEGSGYPDNRALYLRLFCQPCYGHECHNAEQRKCLADITPQQVMDELAHLLPDTKAPTGPKISVVMICKNEESCILTALESVRDADEIVVCDTGSTDSTVSIVEAFSKTTPTPVVITKYAWDDHFANARNAALDAASGDWCLSLDCDEVVKPGTMAALRTAAATATGDTFQMRLFSKGVEDTHWHYLVRFFRRTPRIKWIGRGHEALNFDDQTRLNEGGIVYGYSAAHDLDPDRMMRVMLKSLLDAELAGEKPTTRTLYYLAREFWYRKNYPRALFWFTERTKEMGYRAECADAWLYIARIHWATGKPEEARTAVCNSLLLAPDCREALAFMAEMSFPEQARIWEKFARVATNENVLFIR